MILACLGDLMLGRGVAEEMKHRPPESFWGDTLPLLRSADLVIGGLECAITTHPVPWTRTPKRFHFRAPPLAVNLLQAGGIHCLSLANNHILDFEEQGLFDTLRHLDAAGIAHAGAGRNLAAAAAPAILDLESLRVGVVAFTDNEPGWAAGRDRPGTNYIPIRQAPPILERVAEGVRVARAQGAQLVILSLHWGPNMRRRPPPHFRTFARSVLDLGIDLLHGHSAHIFQGVERYGNKLILYDTGDFLDDYAVDPLLRNDQSLLFLVEVDEGGIHGLQMIPVSLGYARVDRATGEEVEQICRRMEQLSTELGSRIERIGATLHLQIEERTA